MVDSERTKRKPNVITSGAHGLLNRAINDVGLKYCQIML